MKKVKSSDSCTMNAMALAHFFIRAHVLCKQKVKVTMKLAVSADTALKRPGDRHSSKAESSESELNYFCTTSSVIEESPELSDTVFGTVV